MAICNVLLVDQSISDYTIFQNSVNASTFSIVYSSTTTRSQLLEQLTNFSSIDRIGIAFLNSPINLFLENETFFDNINFIVEVIQQYNVKNIDYLACNTLNYPEWLQYYNSITEQTGVIVGASNNQSGNINYGGDWVLENTGQDIEMIYFTQNIEYYTYLLDNRGQHNFLIKQDNTLWCVGNNTNGQLGLGNNTTPQTTYQQVTLPDGKMPYSIEIGFTHTFVLTTDLSVYSCGNNGSGQLGLGNTTSYNTFQKVTMPTGKTPSKISCGESFTVILMTDGTMYGTGLNLFGALTDIASPVSSLQLMTNNTTKTPNKIVCGQYHTVVLMTDNTVYSTGYNSNGQLGLGNTNTVNSLSLITMPGGYTPIDITAGWIFTLVFMNDASGSIYGTGWNAQGQLGQGNTTSQYTSLQKMLNSTGKTPAKVVSGLNHSIVTMTDNTLFGLGYNINGQLGLGNNTVNITNLQSVTTMPVGKTVKSVMTGENTVTVLFTDGTLYGTGGNLYGELGLGNTTSYNSMQSITGVTNVNYLTSTGIYINNIPLVTSSSNVVCFKEGSLILTDKGYVPIQDLRQGDLVKTLLHGFVPIDMIGKRDIYHPALKDRNKNQLYICNNDDYPEVFEPLVITGCHSILIDEFFSEQQREDVIEFSGGIYITDNQYRLPACVDTRAKVYDKQGHYTIYHIALENDDYYMNYGIYANGLLVETCSKRYLKELSNMELI